MKNNNQTTFGKSYTLRNHCFANSNKLAITLLLCGCFGISLAQLNDTGQMACANELTVQLECNNGSIGTDIYLGQDAQHGLDAELFNPEDGLGGFSFIKLDFSGVALADQQADYETTAWSCVQDNITGLMWEVKNDDQSLHDRDWTYSWYNSTGINDGGNEGVENAGSCVDSSNCDTEKFIAAVNAENLCGYVDWRLPSPSELLSIVVFNPIPFADQTFPIPPTIDTDFFPHTLRADYWTSYSSTNNPASSAQLIYFGGNNNTKPKSFDGSVRLVRGQLAEPAENYSGTPIGSQPFQSHLNPLGSQVCNADLPSSTPDDRFMLLDNGAVKDLLTNLDWPRCPQGYLLFDNASSDLSDDRCDIQSSTEFTWQEALENAIEANDTVQMGHADWRVPNIKELFSIREAACDFPAINSQLFPVISVDRTWSSTANDVGTAEYHDFATGEIRTASQQTPYTVRLVRDADSPAGNDVIFVDDFE